MKIKKNLLAKKNKFGQITIFILLGMVLMFLVWLVFFSKSTKTSLVESKNTNNVENYIDTCIEKTAGYGLYQLGIHGGKIIPTKFSFSEDPLKIEYSFDQQKTFPSIESSKQELENYIDKNLNNCINNLEIFQKEYEEINIGQPKSEVIFAEESTNVKVNLTIALKQKDTTKTFSKFEKNFLVRYKKIHELIEKLIDERNIVYSTNEIKVRVLPYANKNAEIYVITDLKSRLNKKTYLFLTVQSMIKNDVCEG